MASFILTLLDTTGIQHYIFASNRLQENIGASELVTRATTLWAFQALEEAGIKRHNIKNPARPDWAYDKEFKIEEQDAPAAEVIYAGGGNALILFQIDSDENVRFTHLLTRRLLEDAPGLNLAVQHMPIVWGDEDLKERRDELTRKMGAYKQSRPLSLPLLGLGVSAVCQSSGLAAVVDTSVVRKDETPRRLVSRELLRKLENTGAANQRLDHFFGKEAGNYIFPYDIDNLGRLKGEESYVAVVHADGNRMGEHVREITRNCKDNRDFITTLRNFSDDVNKASMEALRAVVRTVKVATDRGEVPHAENYLPFRPLVFGGDDVTFLCNGQIGVSLAAAYLEAFERETKKLGLEKMYACAGVGIVKMHYPFARAYALSDDLTNSAKGYVRKHPGGDCSALDWHYATGGLSGDLDAIREREYVTSAGPLTMRPVRLRAEAPDASGRYWRDGLERVILEFKLGSFWADKKNKVVGLREPLRKGREDVRTYLRNFSLHALPPLGAPEAASTGWQPDGEELRCVYFDAVELFDQYIPLSLAEEVPS